MTPTPQLQAWVYPGDPACSAAAEMADGRSIDTLKAQYFTLNDTGTLALITDGCNSYSATNTDAMKAHSQHQFVTISGSIAGITALGKSQALARTFSSTLVSFLHTTQFTGVELDIEGYGAWTGAQYAVYKRVISVLGTALHAGGFQLMIDGPVIFNATYQGYYPNWRYEDFNTLPVDYLVSMCYDLQDDTGAGTPVASLSTITGCCQWMLAKVTDHSKIVIGINSYGYMGETGTSPTTAKTYAQATQLPGFSSAVRDPASGEMMWSQDGVSYDYSDTTTLTMKLKAVLATGLTAVSIWHLGGGNAWVTQDPSVSVTPTPTVPTPLPSVELTAFNTRYPGFAAWYAAHFDAEGTYHG